VITFEFGTPDYLRDG